MRVGGGWRGNLAARDVEPEMQIKALRDLSEMFGEDEIMMTTAETARMLRRSPATLERWRRKRVGPECKEVNGRFLYPRQTNRAFLGLDDKAA
jgi:hypothetical protein